VRFGILHHALNLVFVQARVGLDSNLVFLAGRLVFRRDVQDPVRVDIERHLDLRHAARRSRNIGQVELPEALIAARHLALALQNVDVTADWLSSAVEKVCDALVGIVVFFWISLVITPPSVSMPSESGVTSSSNTSFTSPFSTPP